VSAGPDGNLWYMLISGTATVTRLL